MTASDLAGSSVNFDHLDDPFDPVVGAIAQGEELPTIIQRVVEIVCHGLQADRAIVFQFQARVQSLRLWHQGPAELPPYWSDPQWQQESDCATYEARATPLVPSVLYDPAEQCLAAPLDFDAAGQGAWLVQGDGGAESVAAWQLSSPIPSRIGLAGELWGLLLVQWVATPEPPLARSPLAQRWLARGAQLVAIAVRQASLESQVQQQKQHFEQVAQERSSALQAALAGAQSASRAKAEFLAAMSHELRTPLTCTIGLSATLLRWSFGQLNQRQRDYLQAIHDSGEHLLHLIEDILEVAQIEAGRATLAPREFLISRTIHAVAATTAERAAQRGLAFQVDLESASVDCEGDRFVADVDAIERILANLLANAVKFTHQGGEVSLRAWREGKGLVLQVEDNGIGIPEDRLPVLFEKFQQVDASYDRTYGGLGLGLALVKHLVDLHQGTIEVESTLNQGSTFTVWIPSQAIATQPVLRPVRSPSETFWRPEGKLVAVDADHDRALATCDVLTAAGYQVISTADGLMAIEQIEILRPDMVIVSLDLPDLDGQEVISALRDRPATAALPILALGVAPPAAPPDDFTSYLSAAASPEALLEGVNRLVRSATLSPA